MKIQTKLMFMFFLATLGAGPITSAQAQAAEKEWTILVFLNGHNNLDSYGGGDINEMESVGSTDQVNVVVQWASYGENTKRLLVQKDSDPETVTSPVIQELPTVDMGNYQNLVDFVQWGVQNYPAKHYFIDVWNHGGGWYFKNARKGVRPTDISWDDITGHSITTEQLGQAITQAAAIIGHKVDIYGSDACLMAMLEVAGEMKDSVDYFVGSEQNEPGDGWPYDTFLARMTAKPGITPAEVSKILTEEYTKSYMPGGSQNEAEVTFSALDLSKMEALELAIGELAGIIKTMPEASKNRIVSAAEYTLSFSHDDYRDFGHFLRLLTKANADGLSNDLLAKLLLAYKDLVLATSNTPDYYSNATGASFWFPTDDYTYQEHSERYGHMKFNQKASWHEALASMVKK